MTDTFSVTEVRAALAEVIDSIDTVKQLVLTALAGVMDATTVLGDLGRTHHEPLVPPELLRAEADLAMVLRLLGAGAAVVAAVDARL